MKIIAGNSNRPLAEAIAAYLDTPLTNADVRRFADMEVFVEIHENVRGEDVFVVQSTSYPANDNLMELLVTLDALKRGSARRITAVLQERCIQCQWELWHAPYRKPVPDPPPPSTVRTLFSYYPELEPAVEPDAAPAPAPAPARRDSRCRMATKLASRAIRHQHAARTAGPIRVRWAGIEFRRLLRCSCKYRQTRHAAGLEGRPRYDSRPNLRLP